uniref:Uncharacterized protein n=1 Tax=Anguilla anguilla TaxID=7936 RepID=A0A0E9QEG3_ANGAN
MQSVCEHLTSPLKQKLMQWHFPPIYSLV